jgi:hypothetical protein
MPFPRLIYILCRSYTWGQGFNIPNFQHQIDVFNFRQITSWLDDKDFLEEHDLMDDNGEFNAAARLTYGTTVAKVLDRTHDIALLVLLPKFCSLSEPADRESPGRRGAEGQEDPENRR